MLDLWDELPDLRIAPSSVSRASLVDELNEATRTYLNPLTGEFSKFNSLQVCASEFGTFLTAYEGEFMSTLNTLWDCERYKEKKRGMKEPIILANPQLSLVAGTTPAWLSTSLPEAAWSEGFASRLLMVFSGENLILDPWAGDIENEVLRKALLHDLQAMHTLYGHFRISPEFAEVYKDWIFAGCPPTPEHRKLEHYIPRRKTHLVKIAMAFSAMRSSEMVLRLEDYQAATDLLIEAEATMPDVFKSMTVGSDVNVYDEAFNFVWQAFAKEGKAIAEHRIVKFIAMRTPTHNVIKVLEIMRSSRMLEIDSVTGPGGRPTYRPVPRVSHNS